MANLNNIKPQETTTRNPDFTPGIYKLTLSAATAFKSKKDGSDVRVFEFVVDESTTTDPSAPALPKGARASKKFYPDKSPFAAQLTVNALAEIFPEKLPSDVDSLFNGDQLMRGLQVSATVEAAVTKAGLHYPKVTFKKVPNQKVADVKKNRERLDSMGA